MAFTTVVFSTDLGPMGFAISPRGVRLVRVGTASLREIRNLLEDYFPYAIRRDRHPLAGRLERYARGEVVDFSAVPLDCRRLSPFRVRVITACRRVPFGRTATYGKLARAAGSPGAYRAVGTVMARNPWPIIVPCHRILRSDGGLGGYSAPLGLAFKQRLLEHEARRWGMKPVWKPV